MAGDVRTAKKLLLGREIAHMIAHTLVFDAEDDAGGGASSRDRVKVSHAKAAALIKTSQPRMSGLINGVGSIRPAELEMLSVKLGFSDTQHVEMLLELRRNNHKRGEWSTGHNRAYVEDLRLMVDLERHADLLRTVEVEIMPGLLQTESYIRALHAELGDEASVSEEDKVQARLQRQQVILREDGPEYRVIMSESCLRREYTTKDVMREQLDHLIKSSRRPNVILQLMPFKFRSNLRSPMNHPFVLLRVPSPGAAGPLEVAYVESLGDIRYLDKPDAITAHDAAFARLTCQALSADDTRKFIRHTLKHLAET